MKKNRIFTLIIALLFCMVFFGGCNDGSSPSLPEDVSSSKPSDSEKITLNICVEGPIRGATDHFLLDTTKDLASYYNAVNDTKIDFQFEILKSDPDERLAQIQKLQTEIMAGNGPDIFVFENTNLYTLYTENEVLFKNLNKAMYTGVFADLAPYIAEDEAFNIEDYHQVIMDTGTSGDKRYLLPLSFSYYTAYIPEDSQIATDQLEMSTQEYFQELLNEKHETSISSFPNFFQLFDTPIHYAQESFNIEKQDFANIFTDFLTFQESTRQFSTLDEIKLPLFLNLDFNALNTLAYAKAEGISLTEYPMPNTSGGYTASIPSAVAIGANCENIPEAYAFIKLFLHPDLQTGDTLKLNQGDYDKQYASLYGSTFPGWPVYKDTDLEKLYLSSSYHDYQYPLENGDYTPKTDLMTSAYFTSYVDEKIDSTIFDFHFMDEITETDISKAVDELYRAIQAAASE